MALPHWDYDHVICWRSASTTTCSYSDLSRELLAERCPAAAPGFEGRDAVVLHERARHQKTPAAATD